MDSENIEYGAYMRVYDKLSTGLRSVLPSIAEVALSNKLIHVSTLSEANHRHSTLEDRTQRFLMALGDRIRGDRSAFDLLVKLLDGEYGVDYLAKILRKSYNIEKERYAEDLKKRKEAEEHKSHLEGAGPGSYEVTPVLYRRSVEHTATSEGYYRPSSQALHGKPAYLPLQPVINDLNGSRYHCEGRHTGPLSEPAKKLISSPGSLFLNRNVHSISSGEENAAPTRWAITPSGLRGTATIGMEPSPKVFKKSESGLQMKLDFITTSGNPTSPSKSPTMHTPPLLPSESSQNCEIRDTNSTSQTFNSSGAGSLTSLSEKVDSLSLSSSARGRREYDKDVEATHITNTEYVIPLEKPCNPSGGQDIELPTGFQKPKDDLNTGNNSGIPEQKVSHSDTQPVQYGNGRGDESCKTKADHSEVAQDSSTFKTCFGVVKSQQGPLCLSCGHPLLDRSSSTESTNSPQPSPEIDAVQVTERSPGEYHPLADSECFKKIKRRRRCKHCEMLKKESDAVREELAKLQETLKKDRERSSAQVDDLKEQLYRERLENYELKQRIYNSELRHREAAKTIQQLKIELQEMRELTNIMEGEQAGLKQAYLSCYAKCQLFRVRLQRADSMQCQENVYVENTVDGHVLGHSESGVVHNQSVHDPWQPSHFQGQVNGHVPNDLYI